MITLAPGPYATFVIIAPDGRTRPIEHDQEFPGVAATFGWRKPEKLRPEHIWEAYEFLENHIGSVADDPGYFSQECPSCA